MEESEISQYVEDENGFLTKTMVKKSKAGTE